MLQTIDCKLIYLKVQWNKTTKQLEDNYDRITRTLTKGRRYITRRQQVHSQADFNIVQLALHKYNRGSERHNFPMWTMNHVRNERDDDFFLLTLTIKQRLCQRRVAMATGTLTAKVSACDFS